MNVVFVSNYFNHHQRALCESLYNMTNKNFTFIATSEMRKERKDLGYGEKNIPDYVKFSYVDEDNRILCQKIIDDADVVIAGSAPEYMLKKRIRYNKLIFRYSERLLKNGKEIIKFIPHYFIWHLRNPFSKSLYLLCAGAYTYADHKKYGLFKNKAYKWGYFPAVRNYADVDKMISEKIPNSILWCGRFIDWKHPEIAVYIAKDLKKAGFCFKLSMIGNGVLKNYLEELIKNEHLEDCVQILDAMKPDEIRDYMEQTEIFLFTSDRKEGWGAVLNEAMNSGCAVVASHAIGSVPYLIEDEKNGLICESCNIDDFYRKTEIYLKNPNLRLQLSKQAYKTIIDKWNAETAASAFLDLAKGILSEETYILPESGPCSRAAVLNDDWR